MLWVYGYYQCCDSFSVGIVFRRQNMTSLDVTFWRLKTVPALKGSMELSTMAQCRTDVIDVGPSLTRRFATPPPDCEDREHMGGTPIMHVINLLLSDLALPPYECGPGREMNKDVILFMLHGNISVFFVTLLISLSTTKVVFNPFY